MWNPFRKKEEVPFKKVGNGHFGGVEYQNNTDDFQYVNIADLYGNVSATFSSFSPFPKLTKTELLALESCINFATKGCKTVQIEAVLRPAYALKGLTDKGYLVRVSRGIYKLSFYDTKRT
jgi:hypothetical protein